MATKNLYYPSVPAEASTSDRLVYLISRYWIVFFGVIYGLYIGLPFLAPLFMKLGWELPGRIIYFIYSLLCHQLPERSYFLFGPKISYSLSQIQAAWQNTDNPLILRQFTGNLQMGWKVAWSDRMVSMFTSILVFGIPWWFLRRNLKKLPSWGLLLFVLPMVIDGITHFLSDLAGLGLGFRDSNAWLAALTNGSLPVSFYAGDAWNSFNGIARLVTGILFGAGIVWFGFPYLDDAFTNAISGIQSKWNSAKFTARLSPVSSQLHNDQGHGRQTPAFRRRLPL